MFYLAKETKEVNVKEKNIKSYTQQLCVSNKY